MWNTIRTFNTARFTVALQYCPDRDADYASYDAATRAGIDRGVYTAYCFRVIVLCDGRNMGEEYLGDSIYETPEDFATEHLGHNHDLGRANFPGMLRGAIAEARKTICTAPKIRCP